MKHAARLLGRVTHASNNHLVTSIGPEGQSVSEVTRDASQAPKAYKRKAEAELQGQSPAKKPFSVPSTVAAWTESSKSSSIKNPKTLFNVRMQRYQDSCTANRVEDIGASLGSTGRLGVASARIEQMERRVRRRLGLGSETDEPTLM